MIAVDPPPAPAQALVLAAGRGERMRPLTDTCPKPLLPVRGKPLMQWALERLAGAGIGRVVINTAWLGEQISDHFGPQRVWNGHLPLSFLYSMEGRDFGGALETAGGIVRALPWLDEVFWVLAGDVFAPDFRFDGDVRARFAASDALAHLWLVPNPPQHQTGDFGLSPDGLALNTPLGQGERFTYSTYGLYKRAFFTQPGQAIPPGNPQGVKAPLAPLLRAAMDRGQVTASLYRGRWADVGTPERLAQLNASVSEAAA